MTRIVAIGFLVAGSLFTMSGCDYLPEAITGTPDPDAHALEAVGPSGASLTSSNQPPLDTLNTSPQAPAWETATAMSATSISQAGAEESLAAPANSVVQSGGPTVNDEFLSNFGGSNSSNNMPAAAPSYGLPVPAAESTTMANGNIVVNANVRFVYDQEVAAPADGLITVLDADEGDTLTKGGLIGQLDDRLPKSELEVAKKEHEAAIEKAKDKSEIEYSKASVLVADEDYKITQELEARGASNAMELSKKWLEAKRAGLAVTVAEVKNRQDMAASGVADAKRGAAEVQIELRRIVSPFDGIVADKKKERHDWVRAGEIIMRLVSMEQLRISGQIFVAQLKKAPHEMVGAPVSIEIEIYPGKVERVTGKIGYVSPVLETSGGYKIWAQIPNIQSNGQWVFREGMPAKLEIGAN